MNSLKMIRVMPNTPMQIGEGCTVYSPGKLTFIFITKRDLWQTRIMKLSNV